MEVEIHVSSALYPTFVSRQGGSRTSASAALLQIPWKLVRIDSPNPCEAAKQGDAVLTYLQLDQILAKLKLEGFGGEYATNKAEPLEV